MGLHSPSLPRCEMPLGNWTSILALIRPRQQRLSFKYESLSSLHTSRSDGDTKFLRQNRRCCHRYKVKEELTGLRESSRTHVLVAKPINRSFQQSHRPRVTPLSSSRHLNKSSSFVNSPYVEDEQISNQSLNASGNLEQSYASSSSLVQSISKVSAKQSPAEVGSPGQWSQKQRVLEGEILKERRADELVVTSKSYSQLSAVGQLSVESPEIQQNGSQFLSSSSRQRYIGPVNPYTGPRVSSIPQFRPQQGVPNDLREQWRVSRGVAQLPRRREEYSGGTNRSRKPEVALALQGAAARGNQVVQLEAVQVSAPHTGQVSSQWGASKWSEAAKKIRKPAPRVAERNEAGYGDFGKLSIELEPVLDFDKLFEAPQADELLEIHGPEELSTEEEASLLADCHRGVSSLDAPSVIEEQPQFAVEDSLHVSEPKVQAGSERTWTNPEVLVVDDIPAARVIVEKLRGTYKDLVHACDTEVADIDIKKESPVGHGRLICFSIYCGPNADFGGGKCRLWVDVLGKDEVLDEFRSYFEDPNIKKIWHNYSFDKHILGNHGIEARGFYADTMHLARLLDSARTVVQGGYSLEGLTSDKILMDGYWVGMDEDEVDAGKRSMKHLFGKPNIKKNGEEGKLRVVPPVEELQTQPDWRDKWIHYSAFDTVCTWCLWNSLQKKLSAKDWLIEGKFKQEGKSMWDFYLKYWQPFGELLVQMEANGMLLDLEHLSKIEEVAVKQQDFSSNQFKKWAARRCPDAIYMNVGSDAQIRQLLFGGLPNKNKKDPEKRLEFERVFNTSNTEGYVEEGRKTPKKTRPFTLCGLGVDIPVDSFTSAGWPAVGGASLKALAGKVAIDYTSLDEDEECGEELAPDDSEGSAILTSAGVRGGSEEDLSVYGKAYHAFGGGQEGKEACMAFAALCEVASINTLISNFIQPLQGSDIKGPDGRVHCSLNINTETGRLSARRPSLQNQPALEKDRYKIRQAFISPPGQSLIVADYGQLELRILAHLTDCKSMLKAFEDGGDFHSRTALNMYPHVRKAVEYGDVILEWEPKEGETKPPVPLLKDVFGSERRKAKMLNFSIAYGKTAMGLSKDWKVSLEEAKATVDLWYRDRPEVRRWQDQRIKEAHQTHHVHTLLGRTRHFPDVKSSSKLVRGHVERAAINTPVQGSAADVAMCAMLEINNSKELQELGWRLLLQVHDEVILEGPSESAQIAKDLVVKCMSYPFEGKNPLRVALAVDAKYAQSWYAAK